MLERDRESCFMCVRRNASEKCGTNRSSLPVLLLSIFFFFGGGSSFCHSPRLNFFSPNCHCQFFLSLFTSQYELSDQADYKSKPKFVVPPLRLQNHNFQALFVLFHFSCCLSSALLVFTLPLSSALLSSFQYALLLP